MLSLALGAKTIPASFDESVPRRIDLTGLALIVSGVGLFTLTFDRAPAWGWMSSVTIGAALVAVVLLAAFVVVENRARWPLVELSLFRSPTFTALVVAGAVANIAYAVTVYLSTMNLQQVRGLDPLLAGLAFLGPSAGAAVVGILSGRLSPPLPPVPVMGVACAAAALALGALAASVAWVPYLCALTVCGFTMGLVYAFTTVATQAVVAPERAGGAAGVTLTSLVTLAGVGVAVAGTALETLQRRGLDAGAGIRTILAVLAGVLLAAALAVLVRAVRAPRG